MTAPICTARTSARCFDRGLVSATGVARHLARLAVGSLREILLDAILAPLPRRVYLVVPLFCLG